MTGATDISGYFAAWNKGDLDAVLEWLSEDVVLEDVPSGHIARGAAEARAFVEGALRKAPGAEYEIVTSQIDEDSFAVEWIMRPAGLRGVSVGSLRDGRICANRDYWNAGSIPA
ncbi:nuclear transport factor 2 family protein [Nocardia sp. NBC_00565]|uniref:nuclear transport factor 2 family protein n=1 Tax=Nocardia sp. NBC_00565 TaxID=2975993 RepID=UPI002E823F96|nr:nuclear transport factor 2 family protein [Nocardia sp. NBC_00565]WUC05736.1 nuclear transport factor 2 family protein [Nocardia sp. NBC_00565]